MAHGDDGRFNMSRNFLATDKVPDSIFGHPIVSRREDYTPEELKQIFLFQCKKQSLSLTDECDEYLTQHFTTMYMNRADDYANGRDVRNYFEKVIKARANRLASILDTVTREEYMTIVLNDLQEAAIANNTI